MTISRNYRKFKRAYGFGGGISKGSPLSVATTGALVLLCVVGAVSSVQEIITILAMT